ncbi:MAG TPA: hypothetical protein VFC19_32665 [Candidatus Limnocylindrales bacterium]|nr:hypothetical protein [Candidatus Limnocylindrales bacterium]
MNPNNLRQRATGDPTRVAGDTTTTATRVATSLWRLAVRDGDTAATPSDTRFVSRLARRLVLTYTRRGDAIIDFDGDTALRDAATATTRTYVALTHRNKIGTIDRLVRNAGLTTLRWPRPGLAATPAEIADLLLARQLISATTPSSLAVISTIQAHDTSTTHHPELGVLLDAAAKARFRHEQRVLAFASDGDSDTYSYFPSDDDADAALNTWRDTIRPGTRVDVLRLATSGTSR